MSSKHFSLIDRYEAYNVIASVNVDFDETYPRQTEKMREYFKGFKDYPRINTAEVVNDDSLLISFKGVEKTYCIRVETPRKECIYAMAELINLSLASDIDEVDHIIKNVFSTIDYCKR